MVKNLPTSARDTGSIPGPGRSHMPRSNEATVVPLLGRPRAAAPEAQVLRACALQEETPPR